MTDPSEYYKGFRTRLLLDFLNGNPRAESAIGFAVGSLVGYGARAVLDVGCGIGWSSAEIARQVQGASVLGIDLSPELLELAVAMFGRAGPVFHAADLTVPGWSKACGGGHFDACVMLDVYEHVPAAARTAFHRALGASLADRAIVILSCPTPLHQGHLRSNSPQDLQPVDEDVTLCDLVCFAADIGAEVRHFETTSVWNTHDYFHAVLERRAQYAPAAPVSLARASLMTRLSRRRSVRRALPHLSAAERRTIASSMGPWAWAPAR